MTSREDIYMRFFSSFKPLSHEQMERYTQIDYEREMAFIAIKKNNRDETETLGVVRAICDSNLDTGDISIIIRTDMKGKGLGSLLMDKMIRYCKLKGLNRLVGDVLPENSAMLKLAKKFGFDVTTDFNDQIVHISLDLK